MVLFIILGVAVAITFVVLGVLSFILSKEEQKAKVVPITDLNQLKKDLSSQLFEHNNAKVIEKDSEIIPVFTLKQDPLQVPQELKLPSLEDEAYKKRAQELENQLLAVSKKADGQSDEARQTIETLTKENESLKSRQADLEHELLKARAQSSGLERVNFNYKNQLEGFKDRLQQQDQQ